MGKVALAVFVVFFAVLAGIVLRHGSHNALNTVKYELFNLFFNFKLATQQWPPTGTENWISPGYPAPSPELQAFYTALQPGVDDVVAPKSVAANKWDHGELVETRKITQQIAVVTGSFAIPRKEVYVGGFRSLWVSYPGVNTAKDSPVLLHAHGGGATLGNAEDMLSMLWEYTRVTGVRVLSVDYPLAPENPMPQGPAAMVSVYEALLKDGVKPHSICIFGESGGGYITWHTVRLIKEKGLPLPACAFLLSPMLDSSVSLPSFSKNNGKDIFLNNTMRVLYAGVCQQIPLNSLQCTGIHPDFSKGFPPLYFQASDSEILRDDAITAAEQAMKNGVDTTLDVIPHAFHALAAIGTGRIPEADEAIIRSSLWMLKHIKK